MDKQLAHAILRVFDTPETVDTIVSYADFEIEKANKGLQSTIDTVEIYRLQGVVRSMNVLKSIRTQAENVLKG